jgi:hypothetical protein
MRQVSDTLAAAIGSPEHTVRVRLSCDWAGDGHGPEGSLDDLSGKVASVKVSSVLRGTLPDQVAVVEGTATATFTADLAAGDTDDERLQAVRYFSLSNVGSPLAGLPRLNRDILLDAEFLTDTGWQAVPLLRGVSRNLPVRVAQRQATLTGLDHRSKFRTLVTLPAMAADAPQSGNLAPNKPGMEGTWIVSYVMWRCGFPLSPPPPSGCRIFVPMHGSAMPFIGPAFEGSPVAYIEILPSGTSLGPFFPLEFADGPFVLATRDVKPEPAGPGTIENYVADLAPAPGTVMFTADGRSAGRMTAWIRPDCGLNVSVFNTRFDGPAWFAPSNQFDLTNNGVGRTVNGPDVPADGRWHLVGVQWDDAQGTATFNVDGVLTTIGFTPTPAAPGADDDWRAFCTASGQFAELQMSTGLAAGEPWPPLAYTAPARVDRSALRLDGIAGAPPLEGWLILQELAAAEQGAAYLTADGTPVYATRARLISPAAATPQRTITADAHLFDLAYDHSLDQVANIVTGDYQPIVVASQTAVWSTTERLRIPPLSTLTVIASYSGIATSQRAVTGFANDASDGTGTVYGVGGSIVPVTVTALSDTASRIIVTNTRGVAIWLIDAQNQPALALIGDQVAQGGAGPVPIVAVDEASRAAYGDQPLTLSANRWVQTRAMGGGLAMVTARDLGQPRAVFAGLPIPLDPRLEYFDRVTVTDPDNTGVQADVWVVGLEHRVEAGDDQTVVAARPTRNRFLAGTGVVGVDLVG